MKENSFSIIQRIGISVTLDPIDLRLLELLQRDASRSNQALAEAAGVSPATAHRRVRRLHAAGLVERIVAQLSPQALAAAGCPLLQALLEALRAHRSAPCAAACSPRRRRRRRRRSRHR